ncbi:MAG: alpha/beta hydrolase [Sphingomonadaceae bacterium]|uniref:alpha/beta hydrolase n=1 Tax=Thermaurantiacus sp. TaxID=2820283 RepID=UPI00298F0D95|nr:alpha/beta hydrolase [Thermaurantiacus sp.]MCS6986176.1 alpha/beta hydrolase [Sphingomonadaceae bacterium]MDW8414598.1 alpha/beta hydrolase [Thermaurantiacus sp.]
MPYVRDDVRAVLAQLEAAEGPKMHEVDAPTARQMMHAMAAVLERPAPPVRRKDDATAPGPAGPVPIRVYREAPDTNEGPVLAYFHGGGWVIGNLDTHDSLCCEIARHTGWTVVSVDYRLAPEHRFPAAAEDCLAVTRWLAGSPDVLGHRASGLVLAGDSAGGNLAAVCTRELRREVRLIAQWLIYPAVDMRAEGGSLAEFADGYLLTADSMAWFMHHYAADPDHPWASPLRAQDWDDLPPALVFTCSLDPLRDQGRAYAARLIQAGTRVVYREARGQIHGAMQLRGGIASGQDDLMGQLADLEALLR